MKHHIDKIGFVLCLIGCGGIAEAYGSGKALVISLIMIITGSIMMIKGGKYHAEEIKRTDFSRRNSNILERLYFLR